MCNLASIAVNSPSPLGHDRIKHLQPYHLHRPDNHDRLYNASIYSLPMVQAADSKTVPGAWNAGSLVDGSSARVPEQHTNTDQWPDISTGSEEPCVAMHIGSNACSSSTDPSFLELA